jgi:hypothetical protein
MMDTTKLKQVLKYCPETGDFTWLENRSPVARIGVTAGNVTSLGYISIKVFGRPQQAHRLAFLFVTGDWPKNEVDHKSGVRTDNRWANLRECTHAENAQNRTVHARNTSGKMGVSWSKKESKFVACITLNGKRKRIGAFDCPDAAAKAYVLAKAEVHNFNPVLRTLA